MSAWPEAVWIVREINAALTAEEKIQELSRRLTAIEYRHVFIASNEASIQNKTEGSILLKVVR